MRVIREYPEASHKEALRFIAWISRTPESCHVVEWQALNGVVATRKLKKTQIKEAK